MDLSVIVPTYREAENLPLLVPRVAVATAPLGATEILVVDDDSPDGTPAVCASLAKTYPVRLLLRRGMRGLSGAVLHGMAEARGEILVVLDADLSHPPEAIPALVDAVRRGADFAVGSRYVAGGSTDEAWGLYRRLNSLFARLLARPLCPARDPLSGFFALPRSTLARADRLDPVGYKIALELLVKCRCRRAAEVPIHFTDRRLGHSKLSLAEQLNYLRHLGRLYAYRLRRGAAGRSSKA